jgi:hypothetical protein
MVRNKAAAGVLRRRAANHSRPVRRAHCRAEVRAIKRRSARFRTISRTAEISSTAGSASHTAGPGGPTEPRTPRMGAPWLLRAERRESFAAGRERKIYRFPIERSARATGDRSKNQISCDVPILRERAGRGSAKPTEVYRKAWQADSKTTNRYSLSSQLSSRVILAGSLSSHCLRGGGSYLARVRTSGIARSFTLC